MGILLKIYAESAKLSEAMVSKTIKCTKCKIKWDMSWGNSTDMNISYEG